MVDLERIKVLYDFNRWANGRVLGAAEKLSSDQFIKDLQNSFPSVRDTLVHVMAAEWIWLERWMGTSPKALLTASEFPMVSSIRIRWADIEREQKAFLSGVTGSR